MNDDKKKAIIIICCMVVVFVCGMSFGYLIGEEERMSLLKFIKDNIIRRVPRGNIPYTFS